MVSNDRKNTLVCHLFMTLLVYMGSVSYVITDFGVFPRSQDSYYNMRRISYLVEHNFQLPAIDYYFSGSIIHYLMVLRNLCCFRDLVSLGKRMNVGCLMLIAHHTGRLYSCIAFYWSAVARSIGYGEYFPDALSVPIFCWLC